MPVVEDRPSGHISDSRWTAEVGRRVGRVVTQQSHQWIEDADPIPGEEVDGRPVRRKTDGRVDVGQGALWWRSAESPAQLRSNGAMVVSGPGIKDARMDDSEGARHHRRTELGIPNALKRRLVPEQDDAVAGGEYVKGQSTQHRSSRSQGSPLQRGSAGNA